MADDREGALPMDTPSLGGGFSGEVADVQPEAMQELNAHDKALAKLFNNSDWLAFEDLVKQELIDLRQLKGIDMTGQQNDEIGQKFRVANLAADEIEKLLLRVREAAQEEKRNERLKVAKSNN